MSPTLKVAQLLGFVALTVGLTNCGVPEESHSSGGVSVASIVQPSVIQATGLKTDRQEKSAAHLSPGPDPSLSCENPDPDWRDSGATRCQPGGSCTRTVCGPPVRVCEVDEQGRFCYWDRNCETKPTRTYEKEQRSYMWCTDYDGTRSRVELSRWVAIGCCSS